MTQRHLHHLLAPASVAVFGASDKPGRIGSTVWRNVLAGGFKGDIVPVNPRLRALDGARCHADAASLPFVPDLALLCTPPDTIAALVAQLGERGTRAALIVTAGLTPQQSQATLSAARPHGLRLLGPDCTGLLRPHLGLNASVTQAGALPGELALVSESGALLAALLDWANSQGIGFSHLVSLGQALDVDAGDLLDHLAADRQTRAILLYIESITSPRKFMSAARAAARLKPIVVVKAGRTREGMTEARAGEDRVWDAALRRAGMLRVDTLQELFTAAQALARFRANHSAELMVMTNSASAGALVADAASTFGVKLARPGDALMRSLNACLPSHWSHANPVDICADAPVQRYADALKALFNAPEAGALLFVHAPTPLVTSRDVAQSCAPLIAKQRGRVMSCWLGGETPMLARRMFEEAGAADYVTPEEAVRAFALMKTYQRAQAVLHETPAASAAAKPDLELARRIVEGALSAGREWLDDGDARSLLAAFGIPVIEAHGPRPTSGAAAHPHELMVGAHVDPTFGPVLLFGQGGAAAEVLGDRAVALPPLNRVLARDLIERTRGFRLLAGTPDRPPVRLGALCDALIAVGRLLAEIPELAELVIDPMWADENGVLAADARLRLSAARPGDIERFAIRPYPAELERSLHWQGDLVQLRPIRPEDEVQHREFLEVASPDDLHTRFFEAPHRFSHEELARMTQIDYEREMAFVLIDPQAPGSPRMLGIAWLALDPDNVEAEFAVMVRSDCKRRGLGRLLMQALLDYAASRGTKHLYGYVLRENPAMLALARSLGFESCADVGQPEEMLVVRREMEPPA